MRIALVSVRSPDDCFPISLLCLQAYLKQRQPRHEVDIIETGFDDPLKRILDGRYDLVGIGAMTADYETATVLARNIRASLKTPIVLGGVHISKLPESLRDCFDVGVVGEGEETLCELVSLYETTAHPGPEQLMAIQGLVFRDGKELRQTPPRSLLDLSVFPHLDYSAVYPSYFQRKASASFGRFGVENFLMTSRGCPFRCAFCASSHFWRRIRYHSVEWVIDEIKALAAHGTTLIYITDDLFACNKKRLKAIAERIRAEGLHRHIAYGCSGNVSIFDDETCVLLKSMNVTTVFFGFESGNERILKYLKCGKTSVEMNKEAVRCCRRHGLDAWGTLILGSPGETLEEMEDSIRFVDWAKENGVARLLFAILAPLPGTPVWQTALEMGKVTPDMNFDHLKMDSKEVTEGMLVDDAIKSEFIKLRDRAHGHVHSFKWRKARSLLRDSPWETLKFALSAPKPIIKRMFVSAQP